MGISMPHQERSEGQVGAQGIVEVRDVSRLRPNPLNRDLRGDLSKDDPFIEELAASILQTKGPLEPSSRARGAGLRLRSLVLSGCGSSCGACPSKSNSRPCLSKTGSVNL
jgi:hypothetical protein